MSKSNLWSRRMKKIKNIVSKIILIDECGFKKNTSYFLNLIFVDNKNIKAINKTYRKKNLPTDVLTFVTTLNNKFQKKKNIVIFFFLLK